MAIGWIAIALLAASHFAAASLQAQPASQESRTDPDAYETRGFFLRLQGSLGLTQFVFTESGELDSHNYNDMNFRHRAPLSTGRTLDGQLGYALQDSASRYFMFYIGYSRMDSRLKRSENLRDFIAPRSVHLQTSMLSLGVGLGLLPLDLYIAPELRLLIDGRYRYRQISDGSAVEHDLVGRGYGLTIGKDWWIHPDLRLGPALIYYAENLLIDDLTISHPEEGRSDLPFVYEYNYDYKMVNQYLGLALSLTYN